MNKHIFSIIIIAMVGIFVLPSCGDEETKKFDRTAFLTTYANEVITPDMQQLATQVSQLQTAFNTYKADTSVDNLSALQQQWKQVYLSWQMVNMYSIGPGAKDGLTATMLEELGTYPIDANRIRTRITEGTLDMDDYYRTARGILALDYLLFADNITMSNPATLTYTDAVIKKLVSRTKEITAEWEGAYTQKFIANNGTDVRSATSLMFNEWLRSLEFLKNNKLILPLGLGADQENPAPQAVEAPYSRFSKEGAKANFDAIVQHWNAKGNEATSWKGYVKSLAGGEDLVQNIDAKIQEVNATFDALPAQMSLYEMATQEEAKAAELTTKLKELIRYIKSDMSSLLGITITADSSDGD